MTGPNFVFGSSGGSVSASATAALGQGAQGSGSGGDALVWFVVPVTMTFKHFYCTAPKATTGTSSVFTIRVTTFSGGSATTQSQTGTCTVATGAVNGTATGSWTVNAGQAIDVQVVQGNASGGDSWALSP